MSNGRLVRIRYRQLPDDVLTQAYVTAHGSVVINIQPGLSVETRRDAIRQALRATEINAETTMGPTGVIIPADPIEDVRDDPTGA